MLTPTFILALLVCSQAYGQSPVDNDFESGDMSPWFDTSLGNVSWFVQNVDDAPPTTSGSKILRIKPKVIGGTSGGLAALDGPVVTFSPGDELRFDFWIQSRVTAANDLQVYWRNGTREERLLSLSLLATPTNYRWMSASVVIPRLSAPVQTRFTFYGSLGTDALDNIAIDNVALGPDPDAPTLPPTTLAPASCPAYIQNDVRLPCAKLTVNNEEKCYCVSTFSDTWDAARHYCEFESGFDLVALESAEEEQAILDHLSGSPDLCQTCLFWTSGIWNVPASNYYWINTGSTFSYTNWFQTQPDLNANGACVVMNYVGQWADDQCAQRRQFVCEK